MVLQGDSLAYGNILTCLLTTRALVNPQSDPHTTIPSRGSHFNGKDAALCPVAVAIGRCRGLPHARDPHLTPLVMHSDSVMTVCQVLFHHHLRDNIRRVICILITARPPPHRLQECPGNVAANITTKLHYFHVSPSMSLKTHHISSRGLHWGPLSL
ncbi:hypothetical protein GWK47_025733 [Chionoecetes opilio]|uniref:Uncharacterized protein n=1 Tax=Chionoecetes opilio TaxID=41210 RepID=A0A8J8WC52_CHIOP|nr:hypothetical protein GWK47_025733 [Chionoecetes opilio]